MTATKMRVTLAHGRSWPFGFIRERVSGVSFAGFAEQIDGGMSKDLAIKPGVRPSWSKHTRRVAQSGTVMAGKHKATMIWKESIAIYLMYPGAWQRSLIESLAATLVTHMGAGFICLFQDDD